jgi:hypothetical protein
MHYVTVFDATVRPYRNLGFVLPGFGFVLLGAIMLFRPSWVEALFRKPFRHPYVFRWFFFLFSVFWVITATSSVLTDAVRASKDAGAGNCETIEGRVDHFHPMPAEGHDMEHFDIRGVEFNYSDYVVTAGFNNTASHGGPIRAGLPVRICHRDGEILRLEVAQ